ncbi:C4-dicarboxylate ABC transporter permease [Mesorhizobium sp. Root695]|jgi:TRAP-type C4-dicarboxylate transport system permease small subunit|uniref:TRAP transporter small permease n=1 Tax=unclassified Mesorhizobium TaxID=325217 RepID=UPI0006F38CBA|nr:MULTISPECIES: TRAP transporter small permease [unclassified Mesorhizobium]KQU92368.1 C4-dicarboxylate ABC transporter permease [Mesorhizobium sp. Root102]KRB16414.1 C4-dicarboxylate ABC transporter permease [Mesorhizobium sp. Root695]
MKPFWLAIERLLSRLARLALWVSGIGLTLMTAIIFWQVFSRYVLNSSPSWTEPFSVLLMGWFIFLGAAVGVRERTHLGFDVLLYFLPSAAKAVLRSISDVVVLAFGAGMIVYGVQLTRLTWNTVMPSLAFPGGVSFLPVILGGALVCLFSLERLAGRFAGLPVDADQYATGEEDL